MKFNSVQQIEIPEASNRDILFSVVESLLFVSGDPLKLKDIASIIECSIDYTNSLMSEFMMRYEEDIRGIKVICINDAFQFVTKPQNSDFIQKLLKTNSRQSLSQASLETLAIIAYKQPITRVEVDEIRGVKSDSAIAKLLERSLIRECGRLEVAGRPIQYTTTEEFLKQFNLEKITELVPLEDLISEKNDNSQAVLNEEMSET